MKISKKWFASILCILLSVLTTFGEDDRINLNTATNEQLKSLPHVGNYTAEQIIEMRPIENLEDLLTIRGMKQGKLDALRNLVTLGETPVANPATTPREEQAKTKLETVNTTADTQQFVVLEPTIFSSLQTPPPDAPRKKILVVPSTNDSIVSQVALAQALRDAGHHVDYLDNGYGSGRVRRSGIGGGPPVEIHPRQSEIFGWPTTTNPDYVAYDAIIAGGGTSDLKRALLEAIQRGQLVILETDQGPWAYSHSKDAAKDAEKAYLADQVQKGLLSQQPSDQMGSNAHWEMAPWPTTDNSLQISAGGTTAKRSYIRPTDIVLFDNVLTYSLDSSSRNGKMSFGYAGTHYPEEGKKQGWSEAFRQDYTKRYLLPAVQSALFTHTPKPVVLAKQELTPAPGVPARATLPRTFPLTRSTEEGTVVAWGLSSAPGQKSRTQEMIPIPEGLKAVQVTAAPGTSSSRIHCLALKADGTVTAWGRNDEGQCDVPPGLNNVVSVAAGNAASLAVKADGTVAVWGRGKLASSIPADLTNIVQATFTQGGTLVVLADGTCRYFLEGKPKDGLMENYRDRSGKTHRVLAGMSVEQSAVWQKAHARKDLVAVAGGRYGYGLTSEGEILAFSYNDDSVGMVPQDIGEIAALPTVPDYCDYVAAIQIDGTVRAWGRNDSGQCDVPENLPPIKSLSTGPNHAAAITTQGHLITWGGNWEGQRSVPAELSNAKFIQVFAGSGLTLAIVQTPTP